MRVISILARRSGVAKEKLTAETRLVEDLMLDGDDAVDALLEISEECSLDVSGFDASRYFHSEPTLLSLFSFLSSRKSRIVPKQPLTVGELMESARSGRLSSKSRS
jgi:acyl carrier protein